MRLYHVQLDNEVIIDVQKARNANELLMVVARMNNRYRTVQKKVRDAEGNDQEPISKYYAYMTEILKLQQELQAANTAAMNLVDLKRDRCRNAILAIHTELREVKQAILIRIDELSKPALSGEIVRMSDYIHDLLRSRCQQVLSLNLHDGDIGYIVNTFKGVSLQSGYVSSEIHVKLRDNAGQLHLCLPSEVFVDSEYYPVRTKADVKAILDRVLTYDRGKMPRTNVQLLQEEPCVTKVSVTDTLNVHIDDQTSAEEINKLLSITVPLIKKAVGADSFDVLHRMDPTATGRVVRFAVAKKKVVDTQAMNRLYRILKIGRAEVREAAALMGDT